MALIQIQAGTAFSFSGVTLPQMTDSTTQDIFLDPHQAALFGSLVNLGAVAGTCLSWPLLENSGETSRDNDTVQKSRKLSRYFGRQPVTQLALRGVVMFHFLCASNSGCVLLAQLSSLADNSKQNGRSLLRASLLPESRLRSFARTPCHHRASGEQGLQRQQHMEADENIISVRNTSHFVCFIFNNSFCSFLRKLPFDDVPCAYPTSNK
ncbi:hypothetical protein E2C01_075415 [Portunus trituberculatus]|uniref:Uncharacterized protein n=1 Tax=Portunus trituberculatus TaxID=210409 RepID=A0A5B7IAM6_PORTR|nr:hypothetical protein [Portunus trituberculatus]